MNSKEDVSDQGDLDCVACRVAQIPESRVPTASLSVSGTFHLVLILCVLYERRLGVCEGCGWQLQSWQCGCNECSQAGGGNWGM